MKIVIISDSHGNIINLKHVLGFTKKINAGAIIHCGDWDDIESVETVLNSGLSVYAVLGNADIGDKIDNKLKVISNKFDEKFLEFEIDGRKIGVIHNVLHLPSNIQHPDVIFCGHTHRQKETTVNGIKVVNPGALENEISFAVYNTKANKLDLMKT